MLADTANSETVENGIEILIRYKFPLIFYPKAIDTKISASQALFILTRL